MAAAMQQPDQVSPIFFSKQYVTISNVPLKRRKQSTLNESMSAYHKNIMINRSRLGDGNIGP